MLSQKAAGIAGRVGADVRRLERDVRLGWEGRAAERGFPRLPGAGERHDGKAARTLDEVRGQCPRDHAMRVGRLVLIVKSIDI